MLTTPDTRTEIHSMGVSRIGVVETQELGIAATMLPCAGNHLAMRSLLRIITFWLFAFTFACAPLGAQSGIRPEDLFRVRRPGAVTWSPESRYAGIELSRP